MEYRYAYSYVQEKYKDFTIQALLDSLILYIKLNKFTNFPDKIILPPDIFLKFIYITGQFVQTPTFLGIPVEIDFSKTKE